MYSDPTFNSACALEMDEIKRQHGCSLCRHRDKRYWQKWTCKHNNRVNKNGYCKYWKYKG